MKRTDVAIIGGGLAGSIAAACWDAPGSPRSWSIRTRPIHSTSASRNWAATRSSRDFSGPESPIRCCVRWHTTAKTGSPDSAISWTSARSAKSARAPSAW